VTTAAIGRPEGEAARRSAVAEDFFSSRVIGSEIGKEKIENGP
jgi:hypothetical protein